MIRHLRLLTFITCIVAVGVLAPACTKRAAVEKNYARQLNPGELALTEVDISELPLLSTTPASRDGLKRAIANSLKYLEKPSAKARYKAGIGGISHEQVVTGLQRMRTLLEQYPDDAGLDREVRAQFRAFASVGWDGKGSVLFTGYYTPIFDGSMQRTSEFAYPLYRKPVDMQDNPNPNEAQNTPARRKSNGEQYPDGKTLLASGELKGQELIWLKDPWEAYVVQVQGSAVIRTSEGAKMIGYAGTNGHPYVSVGKELVKDGKIEAGKISMPVLMAHFRAHPEDVEPYIARNPRMVFFRFTEDGEPLGHIGTPVTSDVSVATDKAIFPPAALCISGVAGSPNIRIDQDTGGAIRAPGKCDLYMGVGAAAETRAGVQFAEGGLFYLVPR